MVNLFVNMFLTNSFKIGLIFINFRSFRLNLEMGETDAKEY
jgi:hypothetical protein